MPSEQALAWLASSKSPSIRYRFQRDYLQITPEPGLQAAIRSCPTVARIFAKMHPDGFWQYREKGSGVDYAMSSSTHFVLSYLAELGLDREDPRIDKAVNRYLALTPPDHLTGQSCLYAHNLRTFVLLGYGNDPRVLERMDYLEREVRHDDGYLCVRPSFTVETKSCIRGTVKALMAYAEVPALWNRESCRRTVNYFLKRDVYFRLPDKQERIRGGMSTVFPFVITSSLLEPLYALSKLGYGNARALSDAWHELEKRNNGQDQYRLDWFAPSVFVPGRKGDINEWVTLYALLAWKHKDLSQN